MGGNIVLIDDNQNVLIRYEYDVFGAIRNETGTSDNTRKFTGKEWDADSNLYYYAARYYDPYIGRFTQRDPIGDGVNWYVYTYNNPLKFVDPTGMVMELVAGNQSITIASMADLNNLQQTQGSQLSLLIDILAKKDDNKSLSASDILKDTLQTVIDSSIVTTIQFNSLQLNQMAGSPIADGETIPTTIGDAVDSIAINLTPSATSLPKLRKILVHELSHASNMIKDPALANTNEYTNRLTLEYRAHDLGAKWWDGLSGPGKHSYAPPQEILNVLHHHKIGSYAYNSVRFNLAKRAAGAVP